MTKQFLYSAGSCNIGGEEIKQRKRLGHLGIILTIFGFLLFIIAVYTFQLEPITGVVLFIPAMMGAIGLIQARNKFCAAYGIMKKYNVTTDLGVTLNVEDSISQKKDRNKSLIIVIQSILAAAIVTLISIVIGMIVSSFSF